MILHTFHTSNQFPIIISQLKYYLNSIHLRPHVSYFIQIHHKKKQKQQQQQQHNNLSKK